MNSRNRNRIGIALVGLVLIFVSFLFRKGVQTKEFLVDHQVAHFQEEILNIQDQLEVELNKYLDVADSSFESLLKEGVNRHRDLEKQGIGIYIYQDGNLKFWSSHKFVVPNQFQEGGYYLGQSGHFLHKVIKRNGLVGIAQFLIKKQFRFENSYVKNEFQDGLYLKKGWSLSSSFSEGDLEINLKDGEKLYLSSSAEFKPPLNITLIVVEILGLIMFFLGSLFWSSKLKLKDKLIIIVPLFVIVRYLFWQFKLPVNLHELELFKPNLFAFSKLIPSLGELLLYIVFLLILSLCLTFKPWFKKEVTRIQKRIILIGFLLFQYALSWGIVETIEGVVEHSVIPLDLSNILSINTSTAIALLCIGLIILNYLVVCWKGLKFFKNQNITYHRVLVFVLAFYAAAFLIGELAGFNDAEELMWGFLVLSLLGYSIYERKGNISFSISISLLFVFSMMVTSALREYTEEKKLSDGKKLIGQLSDEKDIVAEYLFADISKIIPNDTNVAKYFTEASYSDQALYKYVKQNYFNGFWEKYDLQINPCFEGDSIQLVNAEEKVACSNFFERILKSYGEEVSDNFYYLDNNNGRVSYIGKIGFPDNAKIYFEFDSKFKPDGLGFPSLLLDKQIERKSLSSEYSFAHFRNGILVKQKGVFNYSTNLTYYLQEIKEWKEFEKDNYHHLAYEKGENVYLLSTRTTGTWDQMAFYSYLFAFFSIIAVLGIIAARLFKQKPLLKGNFKARFQGLIVFILFFSTVFIGIGSIYYLKNQYHEKNFDAISEKIQSVKIEVEHKLGKQDQLGKKDLEYIQLILEKFSSVFFTDINLYDPNGELVSSSQPKIFNEGLAGRRMDPLAMYQMLYNSQSQFVQIEEIEGMQYLSAYVPFYNKKGDLLAYLNLPYFARSNDLKNEISNFIVALLNIYALLIVIALVIALIITNKITEPLRVIQEKMAGIQIGKHNELIHYRGKDEIGRLINEYNRMVIEIAESAQRLAETEREGAWREMAKQVAHEIKNPLTPMKLSIQHLQMRWESMEEEDRSERFKDFAQNLIEQIDTLSAIASEFSSFAKLPDANFSEVDLIKLVTSSVDVYNGTNGVEVTLETEENCLVNGDKDQLLRVFNNLIKNATQAIPEDREGRVRVSLTKSDGNIRVSIADNGKGISDENRSKIFVPNFTTKNSGMGLGLAMVQKIIENMNGEITFQTEIGKGTEFIIILPAHQS